MLILGIETSCDETAAAVVKVSGDEKNPRFEVLSNIVSSQVKLHAQYGGVVPNLAAREHAKNIVPVLKKALEKAGAHPPLIPLPEMLRITMQAGPSEMGGNTIDLIAVTRGPGLIPALIVGTSAAKALAYAWKKPVVGINHMEGHIYANWLEKTPNIEFPALCLIVSGGHTEIVLMRGHGNFELVGKTRDDAVGEAFDKAARLLDLGYPGGPAIAKAAEQGKAGVYALPRPMLKSPDFDFSFSGIKTAVRTIVGAQNFVPLQNKEIISNIAAEFQQAVIDTLIYKMCKAIKHFNPKTIILAGGVAANKELREQLENMVSQSLRIGAANPYIPSLEFCTDNAAMIAAAGYFHRKEATDKPWKVETDANIQIA